MRYYTSTELRAAHEAASARQQASRAPVRAQLSRIHSLAVTRENRVISYGLYGSNTRCVHAPPSYRPWLMHLPRTALG